MNDCFDEPIENATLPCMCITNDLEKYNAQVELPGVKKEDIELEVMDNGLCIRGKKGENKISGCWMLNHQIAKGSVKANYESGLLDIEMPFKKPLKGGRKVKIQ
jgi:HSP20 family protein